MRWTDGRLARLGVSSAFERVRGIAAPIGRRVNPAGAAAGVLAAAIVLGLGSRSPTPSGVGWIYLRDGLPPGPEETLVDLLAVGDVMPGREMAEVDGVYEHVADELRAADLAIGNLEGSLGLEPAHDVGIPLLLPPETPSSLAAAGFDLLSLANNHSLDAGVKGLAETRDQLRQVGIEALEVDDSVVTEVAGTVFAFIAWNDLAQPARQELLTAVRQADAAADTVIVLVHWGQEYQRGAQLPQRELAAALMDAGADIILGSHPHVVQGLQVLGSAQPGGGARLVAYSLGNFVFDQGWDDTAQGLALRLLFDAQGLRAAQALPLWTAPRPRWMDADASAALIERILESERVGFACSEEGCWSAPVAADAPRGEFSSGAIDLTGDGDQELVRQSAGGVEILEGGIVAWRSPPDWHVVDWALGDPNDDGRFEAILAIERAAAGGETVSQPIVIGYRGGMYRTLWGGSPVHAPLLELDLGDVDGDGAEELGIIEALPDETNRYVTVWCWHGWGFSLVWRSPPGRYRDLILLPAEEEDTPSTLSVAVAP
jgi:hypothetical protein